MAWPQALQDCAAAVDRELPRVLADLQPPGLREAVQYYPSLGGKRLRPALAMLACEAAGGQRGDAILPGIAVELVHNFSLVHDDIMDQDAQRRGSPSAHERFGQPTAILAGDALFAKAFECLALSPANAEAKSAMLAELARASVALCEGQQKDMELERAAQASAAQYYDMIQGKTGRLFECSTRLGALAAHAPAERVEALATYGRELGRAFQVRDDILDIVGDPQLRGKPFGSDVRRGKRTILLLAALERARGKDAELLQRVAGSAHASDAEVRQVIDLLRALGAIDAAQREADRAANAAQGALRSLQGSAARASLEELARFSAARDK
jgi:geranylgeranyl diphosphate synthase type I